MATPTARSFLSTGLLAGTALLLASCGGGLESVVPIVSSASVAPAGTLGGGPGTGSYGQKLRVTVRGSALDQGISVLSAGCAGATLLTAAPTASNASTAYYECTVTRDGSQTISVVRSSGGVTLASVPFSVASPQVSLTVGNGTASLGTLVITLSPTQAPVTVDNFLAYVNSGFYVGTIFHRVSPDFVVQGGGYTAPLDPSNSDPTLKTVNAPIVLEDLSGLSNLRWTVAMARTNAANSATSQFFVNLVDNTFLDRNLLTGARGYAVFGTVSAGTEIVTAMAAAPCVGYPALLPGGDCLPLPNLVITAAAQTR